MYHRCPEDMCWGVEWSLGVGWGGREMLPLIFLGKVPYIFSARGNFPLELNCVPVISDVTTCPL